MAEVSASLLDQWRRGHTFRVIIHLDYNEDHTTAPLDDFITTSDIVPYEPITTRLPWSLGAMDGTPESKLGLRQQEGEGSQLERQSKEGRDRRKPQRWSDLDDHPQRITPRWKEDRDDDDNDGHHARGCRKGERHPGWGDSKLRIGHGRDRDRSPRRGHADSFYRDGGHRRAVAVGGEVHHGPFSEGPDCFAFPKPSSK